MRKHALGCPSQNEISNTGVSKCSHDENIRVTRRNIRVESRVNAATRSVDDVPDDVYTMARQMLGEFRPGPTRIDDLLIGDCYDAYALRLLQYWEGICDGSGCSSTEIPSHYRSI
jgi:hypothetical protein